MEIVRLETIINAPIERCFLLSLNVDLHHLSTKGTGEKAISGVTSGIMKFKDTITWRAKHLGFYQNLTVKITAYDFPNYFVSEMIKGAFKQMYHRHLFVFTGNYTAMTDIFIFEAPFGILGKLFSKVYLKKYMKKFLVKRNMILKEAAEGNDWQKFIPSLPGLAHSQPQ
ncbi:MAG TPA: SRPBCC family protein [Chitinophagaceae bacterium]|nr:SRPBCC family protein [Chitinophagaceae bacterium]